MAGSDKRIVRRRILPIGAFCALIASPGCAAVERMATRAVADSLADSSAVYATDGDVELVGQAIPFGLKTIEGLLEELPDHRGLLVAAASGFTQFAYAYVALPADEIEREAPGEARQKRRRAHRLYLRGRDYALRALELDAAGFRERLAEAPEGRFRRSKPTRSTRSTGRPSPGPRRSPRTSGTWIWSPTSR